MASNGIVNQDEEERGITNPLPQDPPPPYQPGAGNYGTSGEPVPPPYDPDLGQEAPPSYESIYGQVKAAKQESSSTADFFKKFVVILLGTRSLYLHDCPRERFIPIYLIVGGVFGVVKNLSSIAHRIRNRQTEQDQENAKTNPFDGTLNCFLLAWFIAGNVWIYRIYNDFNSTDPSSPQYCDPVLYTYAFWVTTAAYIMAGLTCCCVCCAGVLTVFSSGK